MKKRVVVVIMCIGFLAVVQAQKGAFSIAAGPFISVPVGHNGFPSDLKTGGGLIAVGQYSFSNKSALLLQTSLAFYSNKYPDFNYGERTVSTFSLHGGYKYTIGNAGYFINGLAGIDNYADRGSSIAFAIGGGKRLTVKEIYFIDAGTDYVFGDTDNRFNIKAVFSLLRRPKIK